MKKLKEKLVNACKILFFSGMQVGPHGHISARIPNEEKILIPAHIHTLGRSLGDVGIKDIITIDFSGKKLQGNGSPPEEAVIHTAIYRSRSDVSSVVHVHPPIATAFSTVNKEILPISSRAAIFAKGVPILDAGLSLIISEEHGRALVEKLGDKRAVLLRGHGVVVVGESVEEACMSTIFLEQVVKTQLIASQIGIPKPFTRREALEYASKKRDTFLDYWKFYERKLIRKALTAKRSK